MQLEGAEAGPTTTKKIVDNEEEKDEQMKNVKSSQGLAARHACIDAFWGSRRIHSFLPKCQI